MLSAKYTVLNTQNTVVDINTIAISAVIYLFIYLFFVLCKEAELWD